MKPASKIFIYLTLAVISLLSAPQAAAFESSHWAQNSVLAEGKWVKMSLTESGVYLIPLADLRAWGFSDPSRVRVYGYGGRRISDHLIPENYVDDLPVTPSVLTSRGIVFYACGTDTPVDTSDGTARYHSLNPYTSSAYYYLSDRDTEADAAIPQIDNTPGGSPVTTYTATLRHELDATSPAESGHVLLGEDFRFTNTQTFPFTLTDRVEGTDVWMQCDFFARSLSQPLRLTFAANDTQLPSLPADRVKATSEWGDTCRIIKRFPLSGNRLNLRIAATLSGTVSAASLDNISICYTRQLALPAAGWLCFSHDATDARLSGATQAADFHLWDVTDPLAVKEIKVLASGDGASWSKVYSGRREYAAWKESASLPSVRFAGYVDNQDLHSQPVPQMVIVSHADLIEQSRRIAALHSEGDDALKVLVVTDTEIYNEFSSGAPDVNAIRKMLKMFYDREPSTLSSVMLVGAVTHDHRRLTQAMATSGMATLPVWQTDGSQSESSSFSSDDFITFLEDGSGLRWGSDVMSIAVGRLPARTAADARVWVDRLEKYILSPQTGDWRNRVVLLADDEDDGIHATQTEEVWNYMLSGTDLGGSITYQKIYADAYEKNAGVTKVGREKLHNLLNEGVLWWNYIGHASINSLTAEGMLTLGDLSSLYLRRPPFFYGATCSFGHWDGLEVSGLEQLLLTDAGGLIGGITAVRPVYIARNGVLSNAMGGEVFNTDSEGRVIPVGEAMRRAKNRVPSDANKLRYVFMGDPAMRLALPALHATIDMIGGVAVDASPEAEQCVIPALAPVTLTGRITDHEGNLVSDFNGSIQLTIYDAERSVTSLGRLGNTPVTFDVMGERIYAGCATVKDGVWETSVIIPAEIADNFRPATLSLFASSETGLEAGGVSSDFYVYGLAENAIADDKAPSINSLVVNHPDFKEGDVVNASPMVIADISDDFGLNMSTAGVGHQMTINLDSTDLLTDVSLYFTPDSNGEPRGTIAYQLPELSAGNHTATLRVWDIAGNSASRSIDFFVDPTAAPKIFDVYTDANPATVEANFYVEHNRPDAMLEVRIEIVDLGGRTVWANTSRGRADMYMSQPVNWNLTNMQGGKVSRGIYLYRCTVSSADSENASASTVTKRIAVAP